MARAPRGTDHIAIAVGPRQPRNVGRRLRWSGRGRGRKGLPMVSVTIAFRSSTEDIVRCSFVLRSRTVREFDSTSFLPTTAMYGTHSFSARRTDLFRVSP